ncbi:SH3 domain-containing protein [Thalassobius vesicularis]|nr:SH3 domain-containing protein [Thalassobius vesicularis]
MLRFIFLTFVFLGWAFYEASGGKDFARQLEQKREMAAAQAAQSAPQTVAAQTDAPQTTAVTEAKVTRASFEPASLGAANAQSAAPIVQAAAPPEATSRPAPEPAQTEAEQDDPTIANIDEKPAPDVRQVTGARVNMRNGPSTGYNVVARLTRGTKVLILQEPGNGWVKLKVEETGRVGWMAAKLLEPAQG